MAPFPSPTSKWHDTTYPSLSPTRPELSARGKTILITGGGTGIGGETARYFAQAGASRIALLGRREQPLLDTKAAIQRETPGVAIFTASTDVTDKSQVDAAFAKFAGKGGIDVVVSAAAVTGPHDSVRDVDAHTFLGAVDTNLRGALYTAQAFLRHAAPEAVAIEVNSSAAHVNFGPGFASYGVAKLAVFRLWDSLAFANPELSVFHVQPGVVDTDMNKEAGGVAAVGHADDGKSLTKQVTKRTPRIDFGFYLVSLPASFHVWLASPEARFLKGKYLWTNWDVDELKARAKEIGESTQLSINLVGWPFGDSSWKSKNNM